MNRSLFMVAVLFMLAMFCWIATMMLQNMTTQLPEYLQRTPWPGYGPKFIPWVTTGIAGLFTALYFIRRKMPIVFSRALNELEEEEQIPIRERWFQVLVMVGAFFSMLASFYQITSLQVAKGFSEGLQLWPYLAALAIFVVYVVFNIFLIKGTIRSAAEGAEKEDQ